MRIRHHNAQIARFLGFIGLAFGVITIAAADGQTVYNQHCAMCHATGVSGAPKAGHADDWKAFSSDIGTLVSIATAGKGAMPPKGGCSSCTSEDLKAAIEHMKQ
jgi:cytochrome c5